MKLLLAALVCLAAQATFSADSVQPNVLLIMTDDQGYGGFSIHGSPHLQTPHIDELGKLGVPKC